MTALPIAPGEQAPVAPVAIPCLLQFTPPKSDYWNGPEHSVYYFVRHSHKFADISLIDETTPDRAKARVFPSLQQAEAAWDLSGRPAGWEVLPV